MTAKCKIFPEYIPNDWRREPARRAELVLYDAFRNNLGSDWTVFYDVAWLARVRNLVPEDGQTDFILIHPHFGILLVELKGGQISYSATTGQWTSTDAGGTAHIIKDPFTQVQRSKYALKNKLSSIPSLAATKFPIFDSVAFPDVRVGSGQLRLDAPSEIVIGFDDLANISAKVTSIFHYWNAGQKHNIDKKTIDTVIRLFAPQIELRNPLSSQFAQENEEILRLTSNQFKALDGLRRVPRLAISGCAGSGKTVLALEKARQLAEEGFRTLLLCYNRHLADHLEDRLGELPSLDVKTFHGLCHEFAQAAGLKLPKIGSVSQSQIDTEYPLLLCEAVSNQPALKYDAIIVDEAQDFGRDWWDALEMCLKDGKQGVLYAFFDNNQKLYKRSVGIPETFACYELYDNIRNAQPIFRCVEHYYSAMQSKRIEPRGPSGRPVEWARYKGKSDLQTVLSATLKRLVKTEQVRCSDIVILTPHNLEEKSALLSMQCGDDYQLVNLTARKHKDQVGCSTIKRFKGLESNVVIVVELDDELTKRPETEFINELYVALSRARNHLIVLRSEKFNDSLLPL